MNRRHLIRATAAAVAGAALFAAVVWFMDPLFLFILGVGTLFKVCLPGLIVAVIFLFSAIRTGRSRRPALTILCAVAAFGCFVGLAIPANRFIQEHAVAAAKEYPVQIAPLLEAYRQAHGSYPTSLDQLPAKPAVPRLLSSSHGYRYRSDGLTYSFWFGQPGGMIDTWYYDSKTKTWHLST